MARRSVPATRGDIPYLPKTRIEHEAAALLRGYGAARQPVTAPPVPIDEIVEFHLGLVIAMKNMRELFPFADVHGALWMKERIVGVDVTLDPDVYPPKRGRYHYTLGHEAGHWWLHKAFYLEDPNQGALFGPGLGKPAYVCRSSEAKKPVEWQADYFSACLLMPRDLVLEAWNAARGALDPVVLDELHPKQQQILAHELVRRGGMVMNQEQIDAALLEHVSRPLAERFEVSAQAMRIRLEELGLLLRERPNTLF